MSLETTKTGVALEILFRILPVHRLEFLQAVDSLIASAVTTPGLDALSCFEDLGVQNTFLWRERWGSLGELQHRLESTGLKTLLGAIEVLGELQELQILEPNVPRSASWA